MSDVTTIYEVWVTDPHSEYDTPETIAYFLSESDALALRDDYNALPVSDGIGSDGPPGRAYDSPAKVSPIQVGALLRQVENVRWKETESTNEWGPTRRIRDLDHLRRIAAFLRGDAKP